jgi:hypothetical protein
VSVGAERKAKTRARILAVIQAEGEVTMTRLIALIGLHPGTIAARISEMPGEVQVEVLQKCGAPRLYRAIGASAKATRVALPRFVVGPGERRVECIRYTTCLHEFVRRSTATSAHCPDECSGFKRRSGEVNRYGGSRS